MVAAFEEPRGLEEKERMKRTKRERDAKPLQRNASYLWSSVWQTSRETAVPSLLPVSLLLLPLTLCFFPRIHFCIFPPCSMYPSLFCSSSSPLYCWLILKQSFISACGSIQAMSVHVSAHPIPPHTVVALHLCFALSVNCTTLVCLECTATQCLLSN